MQAFSPLTSTATNIILDTEHLRARDGNLDGAWFSSVSTAYMTASKTILWSYSIPDEILGFAERATMPCGVLVLLGLANNSETSGWAMNPNAEDGESQAFFDAIAEGRLAAQADANKSPEQRRVMASDRKRVEQQERLRHCGFAFNLKYCLWRDQTNSRIVSARPGTARRPTPRIPHSRSPPEPQVDRHARRRIQLPLAKEP